MRFSLLLILLIRNFLLVLVLLTFFLIIFPHIFHPNKAIITSKLIFVHLTIWPSNLLYIQQLHLLYLMLASESRSLHPFHTFIFITNLLSSLNEIERNYEIHNKKILVVIRGLENWKHLLEGTKYKFKVWTDHKNLEYFMKMQKLNRRQAR